MIDKLPIEKILKEKFPNFKIIYKEEYFEIYIKRNEIFETIKNLAEKNNLQIIIIPSMRTPADAIGYANKFFGSENLVIQNVDKKAYLSGLSIAKFLVVTCDSTSMISEAALTGKPIYVAQMPPKKNNKRFKDFFKLFENLNIIKNLGTTVEEWSYQKLDETQRVSSYIKEKIKNYDFS